MPNGLNVVVAGAVMLLSFFGIVTAVILMSHILVWALAGAPS